MFLNKQNFFIIFLSFGLITTGLHRLFLRNEILKERQTIFPELPLLSIYIIPLFEILSGFLVWTPYKNIVMSMWVIGVLLFTVSMLFRKNARQEIMDTYPDIFTYQSRMLSVYFHLTWVLIILYMLMFTK